MNKKNHCSICGGKVEKKIITYTQTIGNEIFVVTDVPAEVCVQCGEVYLSSDTVDALEKAAKSKKATRTLQVPVYPFPSFS